MRALIIVDIQNDFLPGGALAVSEGDEIIPIINRLQAQFDRVVLTQDYHPANHGSFASNHPGAGVYSQIDLHGLPQTLWPDHCVQGSTGAEIALALSLKHVDRIFQKGTDITVDSYSGFFDNGRRMATGLGDYLQAQGVKEVYVCGLATDYCVKFTALDALSLGFKTFLIEDASRGVNLAPSDVKNAVKEMKTAGIQVIKSKEVRVLERVRL
jgi:nicotinamidase/pyrazinamidase